MKNIKFEIIRDYDKNVEGYKLGNYYLMKHYYWNNDYEWIINKDGTQHYPAGVFDKMLDSGEIELALSCKEGKQRLIELQSA